MVPLDGAETKSRSPIRTAVSLNSSGVLPAADLTKLRAKLRPC